MNLFEQIVLFCCLVLLVYLLRLTCITRHPCSHKRQKSKLSLITQPDGRRYEKTVFHCTQCGEWMAETKKLVKGEPITNQRRDT